jgi:NAD(P)H-dependent FMN reductase
VTKHLVSDYYDITVSYVSSPWILSGSVREECVNQKLVELFTKHLKSSDVETCTQVCRALGNIFYDNGKKCSFSTKHENVAKLFFFNIF